MGSSYLLWNVWDSHERASSRIATYQPTRDRSAILDMFDRNWYWLVAHFSPHEYSASYRLDYKAPSKNPTDMGKLHIKVYRIDDESVGFIAYYMANFYKGMILFLSVEQEYRGRGIARDLLSHAVDQLARHGARIVELTTRVNNTPARRLYERFGFSRVHIDDHFVTYRYEIGS